MMVQVIILIGIVLSWVYFLFYWSTGISIKDIPFFVAIGFCGSLTTMSFFALENIAMIENKQILNMMINTIANVGLSFLALYGGRILIIKLLH
jgi:fluoride ion exporter CrcB/FEX